nr:MAG TPA: hypothetical protein [Caudoviricetes sp.]
MRVILLAKEIASESNAICSAFFIISHLFPVSQLTISIFILFCLQSTLFLLSVYLPIVKIWHLLHSLGQQYKKFFKKEHN